MDKQKEIRYRPRSAVHVTLQHLSIVGKASAADLSNNAKEKVMSLRTQSFLLNLLPRMVQEGLLATCDGGLTITDNGSALLRKLQAVRPVLIPKDSDIVPANLYTSNSDKDPYEAPELKNIEWRPGSYDYLGHPSVIAGKRTPYHIKPEK